MRYKATLVLLLANAATSLAQERVEPGTLPGSSTASAPVGSQANGHDVLRSNDQLLIVAKDVQGMVDRPYRIDPDGTITLPLVGKVRAEGLTIQEFERELVAQLGVYVRSPQVSAKRVPPIVETASQTVVVEGAFKTPGVHPLTDKRGVLDVISAVGGLQPNASRRIRITRRIEENRTVLPDAAPDLQAGTTIASVNLTRLIENPAVRENILVESGDVLRAEPAVVYLTGQVVKPGSFDLTERESFGLAELIALGGGFTKEAAPQKAMILRPILGGSRRAEITLDASKILAGGQTDFRVLPSDIVVIPGSRSKAQMVGKAARYVLPPLVATLLYVGLR